MIVVTGEINLRIESLNFEYVILIGLIIEPNSSSNQLISMSHRLSSLAVLLHPWPEVFSSPGVYALG